MNRQLLKWIRGMAERYPAPDWTPPAVRRVVRATTQRLHGSYHVHLANRAIAGRSANLTDVEAFVAKQSVLVCAPLVLVSQVQRSGGTLLSQLFDAHPALAAYPHELKFGHRISDRWPPLDPARSADENFRMLFDMNFSRFVRLGFTKGDRNPNRHRFLLIPRVERAVFKQLWDDRPPATCRDILDYHFTAFFNGWLDYQGDLNRKRWVTAFAPRFANDEASISRLFEYYPDGRLIQIVRNPKGWYPSVKNLAQFRFVDKKAELICRKWCVSTESVLRNRDRFGDNVIVLRFEDLVGRTEATMRELSRLLDIDYEPILLDPTFNGRSMHANSSFGVEQAGVIDTPLAREKMLSEDERRLIDSRCLDLYEKALAVALDVTLQNAPTPPSSGTTYDNRDS